MLQIIDNTTVTAAQARWILEKHTARGGVFIDVDRCCDYQAYFIRLNIPDVKRWKTMAGDSELFYTEKTKFRDCLINRFGVNSELLKSRGKESVDKFVIASVLESGMISEDAKEFIELYKIISDRGQKISSLEQYITKCPLWSTESYEGHRMTIARSEWVVLATSRLGAREPSVQNLNKLFADIVTYPRGWLMIRADSGQIEPRITYSWFIPDPVLKQLIILYDDAYYAQYHYITMTKEEMDRAYANPFAIEKKPLIVENRQQIKRLGLAGNYGGQLANEDQKLAIPYKQRIVNHPGRLVWEKKVRDAVENNGQEVFYGAFGAPVRPEDNQKYQRGTPGWNEHLIRCGINNPVQTTASELACQGIYEADKILTERGHEGSWIGYFKHDEGLYYLEPRDYKLASDLCECVSYQVEKDGQKWIPIKSDVFEGKKKGIEDVPVIKV